mmetsp:Transcript_49499/g.127746  ORF Transcript_49499/g.127746 Transcript_49499/m.127746 type:complete len:203 (+) Transcript_49499:1321-1929(+)
MASMTACVCHGLTLTAPVRTLEQPLNSLTIMVPLGVASYAGDSTSSSRRRTSFSWAQQKRKGCRFRPSLIDVSSKTSTASIVPSLSSVSRSPTVTIMDDPGCPGWPTILLVSAASRFISRTSSLSAPSAVRRGSTCCSRPTRFWCCGHSERNLWKARILRIMPEKGWSPSIAPKTILSPNGLRILAAASTTSLVLTRSCSVP